MGWIPEPGLTVSDHSSIDHTGIPGVGGGGGGGGDLDEGTYTPVLTASTTNPTLGTGAVAEGRYIRIGRLVRVWVRIVFGSGMDPGSSFYHVSLPFEASADMFASGSTAAGQAIGVGHARDNSSATSSRPFSVQVDIPPTRVRMVMASSNAMAHNVPWTWAADDVITFTAEYLIDET